MFKLLNNHCSRVAISSISKIGRGTIFSPNFTYNTCISSKVSSSIKIGTYPVRKISTSQTRYINPVVVFFFRPVGRLLFLILGKLGKRSWQKLPQRKKQAFFNELKSNQYIYAGFCAYITGGLLVAYEKNVSYCPITSKRKFKLFSDSEIQRYSAVAYQFIYEVDLKKNIVNPSSHQCNRLMRICRKLVDNNEILQKFNWEVLLVHDDNVENAFSMSDGHLIVYTGLFNLCQTDDDLATVLSHEMAHVVLEHANFTLSRLFLIDFFISPMIFFTWLLMPDDVLSIFLTNIYCSTSKYSFELPHNRGMELEADFLGLLLLTNACYDVRKSVEFWMTVHEQEEMNNTEGTKKDSMPRSISSRIEMWRRTHPTSLYRHQHLKKCTEQAIKLRSSCGCLPLDSNLQSEHTASNCKTHPDLQKLVYGDEQLKRV